MKKQHADESYGGGKRRSKIITHMVEMIDGTLKNYKEPVRQGTAKGEPIGFSKKKMKAAWLMILHPYCLSLKDIANLADVSAGVLRVWCHRDDFNQEWIRISHEYGEQIATRIKGSIYEEMIKELSKIALRERPGKLVSIPTERGMLLLKRHLSQNVRKTLEKRGQKIIEIDDGPDRWSNPHATVTADSTHWFMEQLPWFNDEVQGPILQMLEENMHMTGAVTAYYTLMETRYYWEDVSPYRMRKREIRGLKKTKMLFGITIDMLTDPRGRKKWGEEAYAELATSLKEAINQTLDILAS